MSKKIFSFIEKYSWELISILFIFVISFSPARWLMANISLSPDELYTWRISSGSLIDQFTSLTKDTQMPLYYLSIKLLDLLLGDNLNDFWIRVPSYLFFLTNLSVIFLYARSLKLSYALAAFSILPILLNSNLYYYSIYARPYSLLVLLITINLISLSFLLIKKRGDTKKILAVFHISLFLTALTHHLFLFYVFALVIAVLLSKNLRKEALSSLYTKGWLIFQCLWLAIIYMPSFCFQFLSSSNKIAWISSSGLLDLKSAFLSLFFPSTLVSGLLIFILVMIAVFYFFLNKQRRESYPTTLFYGKALCLTLLLFYLVSNTIQPVIEKRYLLILLPFISLLTAHFLKLMSIESSKKMIVVIGIMLSPMLLQITPMSFKHSPLFQKQYIKQFIREIEQKDFIGKTACLMSFDFEFSENLKTSIFSNYSKMYFGSDICDFTFTGNFKEVENLQSYGQILFYDGIRHPNKNLNTLNKSGFIPVKKLITDYESFYLFKNSKN